MTIDDFDFNILLELGDDFTNHDLAKKLGVEWREVDELLNQLEKSGFIGITQKNHAIIVCV